MMAKGILKYNGKHFKVYEFNGYYTIYQVEYNSPISKHKSLEVALKRAKAYNKKADDLPWWDR